MSEFNFKRVITGAEADKGHITIPKSDAEEFLARLGEIKIEKDTKGLKSLSPEAGFFDFKSKNGSTTHYLKIVRRSPTGSQKRSEVRLYLRKELGWAAEEGDVLRIQIQDSGDRFVWLDPFHGENKEEVLQKILQEPDRLHDSEEEDLNSELYGDGLIYMKATTKVKRSTDLAKKCLVRSNYKCEAGFTSPSFISKTTKETYLEAHHMIPNNKKNKDRFNTRLDRIENLYALSPHAHRAIHRATYEEKEKIITSLLDVRDDVLDVFNLTKAELLKIYDT
jgi:predicted HNH restriction endonuclease